MVNVEMRDGYHQGRTVVHSRARAVLAQTPPAPPAARDLGPVTQKPFPLTIDEIYEKVLFHGREKMRGIRPGPGYSDKGMAAKVIPAPPPSDWMTQPLRSTWIADPLMLDSALQLASVWCYETKGMVFSSGVCQGLFSIHRPCPRIGAGGGLEVQGLSDRKMSGDITFMDENNKVVFQMKGYEAMMDPELYKAFKP